MSIIKQREEIDRDESPIKKIKLERSPKTRFPPINRYDTNKESGAESPFRKYYEEGSLSKQKSIKEDDNFTGKVISLVKTKETINDYDTPYYDRKVAVRRALNLWQTQREKKVMLNRSEEQLMRSIKNWGSNKSKHHERQLMSSDRHSIVYNDYSRTWKVKPKKDDNRNSDLSKSFNISHDQFLDTDNESLKSSEDEDQSKPKKTNNQLNDYSFDEEAQISNLMKKIHDMSQMSNDHDIMFSSSIIRDGTTGDDTFFLTKKNIDGDVSPSKRNPSAAKDDTKPNA